MPIPAAPKSAFKSLVPGGFFASDPEDRNVPVSIRMNNPGAVNGAAWERTYPGYLTEIETTPGNRTTIFSAPEYGVAVWWELLRKYASSGYTNVGEIINRYGGGQDYSTYVAQIADWTGLNASKKIDLHNDDTTLLKFAKGMFRYEAGKATPLSDAQILYGFRLARARAAGGAIPAPSTPSPQPSPPPNTPSRGGFAGFIAWLVGLFGGKSTTPSAAKIVLTFSQVLKSGAKGEPVLLLQKRLHQLGFSDLNIDGEFGEVTEKAVKEFQLAKNLDPDGEVGELTIVELNAATSASQKPPLNPPPVKSGEKPPWYTKAEKWIGWKEVGNNRGIEELIEGGKCGSLGDPYCAIAQNFWFETSGFPGTRSAMARSFEKHSNFINLGQPALGAIVTMWRGSPNAGTGHVFLYDGENDKGVRGIGANESDMIKRSFHDRSRIVAGYWWPKSAPRPAKLGKILVNDLTTGTTGGET